MKLLLLCLGLTLVCADKEENNDVVRSNFDLSKISGEWYSIGLASDRREKIEENGSMRLFVEYIDYLKNSSLFFKYHTIVNGECTENYLVSDPTEENGVYSVEYDGPNTFRILEADYNDHIIFYLENFNNDETFQLMELYGREPDVSPELKEKFVQICEEHGIDKENVLDLTKVNRCLQARDGGAP
ncbi:PREDICTED: major allergen Equ c 1-like [Galeopterus variegatus]|uniref:Major allergen Equ c 1-like n=1 Tax=Galeopterus variegatus TaxID=482537 RepID=A0ABM0S4U6_GALVR|nr:PREDICTED: major allergen Equ c 1-like [Galeopterus variegatus]